MYLGIRAYQLLYCLSCFLGITKRCSQSVCFSFSDVCPNFDDRPAGEENFDPLKRVNGSVTFNGENVMVECHGRMVEFCDLHNH